MLSKSSHSFTPSPYGYSPCPGESADDHIECIHSVKTDSTVPLRGGRSETFRGLAKCQSVSSEGSTVLCATEDPQGSTKCGGGGKFIGQQLYYYPQ